jgi:signal transduction histidine kinase
VDAFFAFIEHSELSEWVRGSDCVCAFPTIVTLHNIGMVFLAGGSIAIDLRIIGFAPQMPLQPMGRFVPVLWLAFAVIAVTGILMLIGYPTKALTNPLFYIKLCLVAVAGVLVYRIAADILRAYEVDRKPLPAKAKVLAIASLATWIALIAAGRYLGYTHRWEMLGVPAVL